MTLPLIAIIGSGHMGESLISGLIASGHPANKIFACDPNEEHLTNIRSKWPVEISSNNADAITKAAIILFAVKPQQLKAVIQKEKALILNKKPLLISIAAGIRTSAINTWLHEDISVVRAMPNMPALIQTGVTALYANDQVQQEDKNLAESILRSVGTTIWMTDEDQMDIVTALSGSGPAYFFYIMDALQEAGMALGLSEEVARLLTIQTAFGAAKMVLECNESLKTLRQQVTSKGGTTEKAIQVFEAAKLQSTLKEAVRAARDRSLELAQLLDGE